ncbi:hypothetical protein BH20GEM2_BH20GEM2_20930 [soil metagenome]
MILTDRFVYVHEPKTGGTFVRAVLSQLHGCSAEPDAPRESWTAAMRSLLLRPLRLFDAAGTSARGGRRSRYGPLIRWGNKHGTCSDIPEPHCDKPILATVRNPYDLYVSEFEFGWWKKEECRDDFRDLPGFNSTYSHFPDLTFEEYVRFLNFDHDARADGTVPIAVGAFSKRFAKYYCRNPDDAVRELDVGRIAAERYRHDLFDVRFVATDRLNEDLPRFLVAMEYAEEDVRFIRELNKIRPPRSRRRHKQQWDDYYTSELKGLVRERERLLFTMFPQFDL